MYIVERKSVYVIEKMYGFSLHRNCTLVRLLDCNANAEGILTLCIVKSSTATPFGQFVFYCTIKHKHKHYPLLLVFKSPSL